MAHQNYITLGGKGSSALTPSSLFSIATSTTRVRIDSSSSSLTPPPTNTTPFHLNQTPTTLTLSPEESRASLTVLLTRLLHNKNNTNNITLQLTHLINQPEVITNPLELDVVDEAVSREVAVVYGVSGLIDYKAGRLCSVVDAVAALSCEAARAGVKGAFELTDSGDGNVDKEEVGVASDMGVFVNNSKLVDKGKVAERGVGEIVEVHGGLRGACKYVHSKVRVWLNCGGGGGDGAAVGKNVVAVLSLLGNAVLCLGESSLCRARLNLECKGMKESDVRESLLGMFEERCPSSDGLKGRLRSALEAGFEGDFVRFVHEVYLLLMIVWEAVTWEAITAFVVLDGGELSKKSVDVKANGGDEKADKKGDKKKKKKVLGNGTEVVVQLVKDRLRSCLSQNLADDAGLLQSWVAGIFSLLDPKDAEFNSLLEKLKEIVDSNASRRLPKLPKGTRDFGKEEMAIRKKAFSIIEGVFERHGATALDTPVFELRETLMGKYGEDSKLIYDLANQGGELCSLRYDLTVPFARYVAMHGITALKRYQIAKVYRRDNPSKGRYREFYQCDFDIAGQYERMGPDFEVVAILTELLDELDIGDYEIKLNHRKLLDGMLEICGVPPEKFRTICSSIDKLDKQPFEKIKKEMVEEKGLSDETADKIGNFVKERGSPLELLSKLKQQGSKFLENNSSVLALNDLEILFKALDSSKCIKKVVFDLSLARGLDYYTGVIFEAVFKGVTQVGSIAAGGRYDNLIGMFGSKQVPAVGVSLGIERVFNIMEQLQKEMNEKIRPTKTQVLVSILGDDISLAAELACEFWNAKVETEFMVNKRVNKHIDRALESRIPWMVLVGDRELNARVVRLKNIAANQEEEVPRSQIVEELKKRLNC